MPRPLNTHRGRSQVLRAVLEVYQVLVAGVGRGQRCVWSRRWRRRCPWHVQQGLELGQDRLDEARVDGGDGGAAALSRRVGALVLRAVPRRVPRTRAPAASLAPAGVLAVLAAGRSGRSVWTQRNMRGFAKSDKTGGQKCGSMRGAWAHARCVWGAPRVGARRQRQELCACSTCTARGRRGVSAGEPRRGDRPAGRGPACGGRRASHAAW
jgi:hypothetical protein